MVDLHAVATTPAEPKRLTMEHLVRLWRGERVDLGGGLRLEASADVMEFISGAIAAGAPARLFGQVLNRIDPRPAPWNGAGLPR